MKINVINNNKKAKINKWKEEKNKIDFHNSIYEKKDVNIYVVPK